MHGTSSIFYTTVIFDDIHLKSHIMTWELFNNLLLELGLSLAKMYTQNICNDFFFSFSFDRKIFNNIKTIMPPYNIAYWPPLSWNIIRNNIKTIMPPYNITYWPPLSWNIIRISIPTKSLSKPNSLPKACCCHNIF